MKTLYENAENLLAELKGYDELKAGEKFIYIDHTGTEVFGIKIDDNNCAFLNGEHKFILAKKFKNRLSTSFRALFLFEYASFAEAEEAAKRSPDSHTNEYTNF